MIPRNRRPTFASRVRRNIVHIVVRSLSFFNHAKPWTRRWDLFFGGHQNYPNNTVFFHFVLQTAHPTAHNRFILYDANGRPQLLPLIKLFSRMGPWPRDSCPQSQMTD